MANFEVHTEKHHKINVANFPVYTEKHHEIKVATLKFILKNTKK